MNKQHELPNNFQHILSSLDNKLLTYCMMENIIPLAISPDLLTVASVLPLSPQQQATLRFLSHCQIKNQIWSDEHFAVAHQVLERSLIEEPKKKQHSLQEASVSQYGLGKAGDLIPPQSSSSKQRKESRREDSSAAPDRYSVNDHSNEPVIQFINQVLQQALLKKASDIHIEPVGSGYRIRQRIDGVLYEMQLPCSIALSRVVVRIKVMAELDIAEKRLPQDGQLSVVIANKHYALRVSTLPVVGGEKIVLRIIEAEKQLLTIEQLGMTDQQQQDYLNALNLPQGVILVTGPTGSGKTVTLYSGMQYLNQITSNICTIEDPVEINQYGINQTQVNNKIGLSFNQTLRALLRQDPDVIMVGEIRDHETANIAMEAGQTGHLVLSTLHTNSTVDTIIRLRQMGIANYLLVSSVNLIMSQRLIRCLCEHCKSLCHTQLSFPAKQSTFPPTYWQAIGCNYCAGGYSGRTAIYELLPITTEIRQALLDNMSVHQLKQLALQSGMVTLYQSAIEKLTKGITSLTEIYRVLGKPKQ